VKGASSEIPKLNWIERRLASKRQADKVSKGAEAGKRLPLPFSSACGKDFPNFGPIMAGAISGLIKMSPRLE
jgi:hypothetical protein